MLFYRLLDEVADSRQARIINQESSEGQVYFKVVDKLI